MFILILRGGKGVLKQLLEVRKPLIRAAYLESGDVTKHEFFEALAEVVSFVRALPSGGIGQIIISSNYDIKSVDSFCQAALSAVRMGQENLIGQISDVKCCKGTYLLIIYS